MTISQAAFEFTIEKMQQTIRRQLIAIIVLVILFAVTVGGMVFAFIHYEESFDTENYSGRYSGTYGNSYGNSYGRNARRDSMGRYSRDDGMIEEMRNLANSLPSGQRSDMERLIHKMENM